MGPLAADGSSSPELGAIYDQALLEIKAGRYDQAIRELDAIDARAERPEDKAESMNLRGVILTREGEYEAAEKVLQRAAEIEPKLWNARFNLAEIPFLKKDWAGARRRFAAMQSDLRAGIEKETRQLIDYKILLTYLLEGNDAETARMIDRQAKESPVFYYARAARAREHKREAEAKNWRALAERRFPAALNKLYAESFYEIGWERKSASDPRESFEIVSRVEQETRRRAEGRAIFEQAEQAFLEGQAETALSLLNRLDGIFPGQTASSNLRGEILLREKKLDQAEAVLRKALAANPGMRETAYNLARLALLKKKYGQARNQFERLFGATFASGESLPAELIKFEIFLTFLLEGNESEAQQFIGQFKFTGPTPALYYAEAARAFAQGNPVGGNDWVASARKIYSPALNFVFADSFIDIGWLEKYQPARPAEVSSEWPAVNLFVGPAARWSASPLRLPVPNEPALAGESQTLLAPP